MFPCVLTFLFQKLLVASMCYCSCFIAHLSWPLQCARRVQTSLGLGIPGTCYSVAATPFWPMSVLQWSVRTPAWWMASVARFSSSRRFNTARSPTTPETRRATVSAPTPKSTITRSSAFPPDDDSLGLQRSPDFKLGHFYARYEASILWWDAHNDAIQDCFGFSRKILQID